MSLAIADTNVYLILMTPSHGYINTISEYDILNPKLSRRYTTLILQHIYAYVWYKKYHLQLKHKAVSDAMIGYVTYLGHLIRS